MAAILNPAPSSDVLFPEDGVTLDDSFYSAPPSNYSSYSTEVKYIFNPAVAARDTLAKATIAMVTPVTPSQESEYSEIDHLSLVSNSSRNSTDVFNNNNHHKAAPRSASSSGSPGGRLRYVTTAPPQRAGSGGPEPDLRYGLSVRPTAKYPAHYSSVDNLNIWHHNNNGYHGYHSNGYHGNGYHGGSQPSVRHHSTDGASPGSRTDRPITAPRSGSSEGKHPAPMATNSATRTGPLPKTPPKPKRSLLPQHNSGKTPDGKPRPQQPPHNSAADNSHKPRPQTDSRTPDNQAIYATPVLNAQKYKPSHPQGPPVPPPPPRDPANKRPEPANKKLAAVSDFAAMAARRRTWSPPAFSRALSDGHHGNQLSVLRCYHSNDQLDMVCGDRTYEDLDTMDTLSNSSAPPKLTPQSGQLNKIPHERIIKPIAFKPIVSPGQRYPPATTDQRYPTTTQDQRYPTTTQDQRYPPATGDQRYPASTSDQRYPPTTPPARPSPPSSNHGTLQNHNTLPSHRTPLTPHSHHNTLPMSPRHEHTPARPPNHSQESLSRPSNHSQDSQGRLANQDNPYRLANHSQDTQHRLTNQAPDKPHRLANHSADDGYISQDSSHMMTAGVAMETVGYKTSDSQSLASSNMSRVSSSSTPGVEVAPSPTLDLEAILRRRDTEIAQLRDTMERNESAILQVYEEKRQNWQVEVREFAAEWERRLATVTQQATTTEAALRAQISALTDERQALTDALSAERAAADLRASEARGREEELQWEARAQAAEVGQLRAELREAQDARGAEMAAARREMDAERREMDAERRDMDAERQRVTTETTALRAELATAHDDVHRLTESLGAGRERIAELERATDPPSDPPTDLELCRLRTEIGRATTEHQRERETWLDEKTKVIRYQKHLQLNYVQMMRKNKTLEAEVQQLTLELEGAGSGHGDHTREHSDRRHSDRNHADHHDILLAAGGVGEESVC